MPINNDEFCAAMRNLAGHVCLITTSGVDGTRNGLTATAVCSVSAEPPTVMCSVFSDTESQETIQKSGNFAINMLAASQQQLADRFAGKIRGEERFLLGDWSTLETGAPILQTALVGLDCRLVKTVKINTHSILFGEVQAVHFSHSDQQPLLYAHGHYGELSHL